VERGLCVAIAGTRWRIGGRRKCAISSGSADDAGNRSTILSLTPPSGLGDAISVPSSTDRLSPVSEVGGDGFSRTRSLGALDAIRPELAWLAAFAPALRPAHTPRATPPPSSTAELRIAPCVVCGAAVVAEPWLLTLLLRGRVEDAVTMDPRPCGPGVAAGSLVAYAMSRPDRAATGRELCGCAGSPVTDGAIGSRSWLTT
jgi:hypothetical protein